MDNMETKIEEHNVESIIDQHTWAAPKIWGGSKSPKRAEAGPKMLFLYCFKSENLP